MATFLNPFSVTVADPPIEEVGFCGCTNEELEAGATCLQPECPGRRDEIADCICGDAKISHRNGNECMICPCRSYRPEVRPLEALNYNRVRGPRTVSPQELNGHPPPGHSWF